MSELAAIAIVGPTGVGKTALAVALAKELGNTELINADSRQVITGLAVGTAAPTAADLEGIPCHCLAMHAPGAAFSVADWLVGARQALRDIQGRDHVPIVVGGTGLYVEALLDGFRATTVPVDQTVREQREQVIASGGLAVLVAELANRDPGAITRIDTNNPRRVIRALEILDSGASTLAETRIRFGGIPSLRIGLDATATVMTELIKSRAESLFEEGGILTETSAALAAGTKAEALSRCGIGYREAVAVLDGTLGVAQAIAAVAGRTRRYVKAQRTWFRRDQRITWLVRDAEPVATLLPRAMELWAPHPKHPFV